MRRIALLAAMTCLWMTTSCAPRPAATPRRSADPPVALDRVAPPIASITAEPAIRVRVGSQQPSVRLGAASLTIGPGPTDRGRSEPRVLRGPVTISRASGAWLVADATGATLRWPLHSLAAEAREPITIDGRSYPGTIVVHPAKHDPNRLDVVNHVGIETYLPGVLQKELFPKWHDAAYRAQAVAARSYAVVQMARNRQAHWDLESTQASQVYGGQATHPGAIEAVRRTRGQLLVYHGRVVEAFYSSSSGGVGQDAAYAFTDRAGRFDIPPLRGRRHGWGTAATYYRWGPISRDAGELARRLAAWGRANDHPVGGLSDLREVRVTQRSSAGRPARFAVIDARGRSFALACESFRFACNADAPGLPAVPAAELLRSSNVEVQVVGRTVRFTDGRGFGHGVGLDQWAAQDMASRGHDHPAILATFYPEAQIQRAY